MSPDPSGNETWILSATMHSTVYVLQYMLKVNDVKTKRGVDFAEHLVGYYQAQEAYVTILWHNLLKCTELYKLYQQNAICH